MMEKSEVFLNKWTNCKAGTGTSFVLAQSIPHWSPRYTESLTCSFPELMPQTAQPGE